MKNPIFLMALAVMPWLQGCMNESLKDDPQAVTVFNQTVYIAQEGSLIAWDLVRNEAREGTVTDVKSPTDMQALKDGTILVNLSGSNEILALDGRTMVKKKRMASSENGAVKPVHSYLTPEINGRQFWVSLNDGDGTKAKNSVHFVYANPDSSKFLEAAGEAGLGIGHHKAAWSPNKARAVISNIGDCDDIMTVFDYSDVGAIRRVATLDAAGAGFDGSDKAHTCDQTKGSTTGISPAPHGCAAARNSAHAVCNMTGNGVLVAIDLDAGVPSFKRIPTHGKGGGYTSAHPGGRYLYTLHSQPREGDSTGLACQLGQLSVVDAVNDSLVQELPLLYTGAACADSINSTPVKGASPSHILFSLDGGKAFVNIGSGSDSLARVRMQLALDLSDPAHPKQLASIPIGATNGSHGETLSGDGKYLLVANNKDGTLSQIDVGTGKVTMVHDVKNAGKTLATYGSAEGPGHQAGPFH